MFWKERSDIKLSIFEMSKSKYLKYLRRKMITLGRQSVIKETASCQHVTFQKYNKSPDDKTWQRSFWMSRCQTLHIIGDKCWQLYKHLFVSKASKTRNQILWKQLRLLSILTHRKGGNESVSSVQKVQHFQQQKRHSGEKSNNFK